MAKDKYHELVKEALVNAGWRVTHDPYPIKMGKRTGYIDLGAERGIIGAEKENEKIAVEIKTFFSHSDLDSFEDAVGQFLLYSVALADKEPDRTLFLAMPKDFYERFFDDAFFVRFAKMFSIKIIVYNELQPIIEQWIIQ